MQLIIELSNSERNELILLLKQEIKSIDTDLQHRSKMPTLASLLEAKRATLEALEAKLDAPIQGTAFVAQYFQEVKSLQALSN